MDKENNKGPELATFTLLNPDFDADSKLVNHLTEEDDGSDLSSDYDLNN